MKERGLCTNPDHDNPNLICGHPLPCPHHTLVMNEDEMVSFCEELDAVSDDPEAIAKVIERYRAKGQKL